MGETKAQKRARQQADTDRETARVQKANTMQKDLSIQTDDIVRRFGGTGKAPMSSGFQLPRL